MARERKMHVRGRSRRERYLQRQKSHIQTVPVPPPSSHQAQNFTSILSQAVGSKKSQQTQVILHLGPANSGKTYDAIETLKKSATGIYLAPLRLLAWEVADKLNESGHPCSLLTGEEKVIIPGAPFMSSTVEMFNPDSQWECIVLDESQMLADEQRGWAWMRVLALSQAKTIEIIASPDAEHLIAKLLRKLGYNFTVVRHERLSPLTVAERPWRIDAPDEHTIYVVFSRAGVLSLKTYLERLGWTVAAIYGNLPPEVKKKQAERFVSGEAKLCVATDAIGMGMNLPASKVCFTSLTKYDGEMQRTLTPSEARQIAGRAGRYMVKETGEAGALTNEGLKVLRELLSVQPPDLEYARISPEFSDIQDMTGPLAQRLELWEKHKAIPKDLRDVILPADLEHQKTLATFLKEEDIQRLGLEVAFTLIKVPASRDSFSYWLACVRSIIENKPMPLPVTLSQPGHKEGDFLLNSENVVEQCDVYLWISNRSELSRFALEKEKVLNYKWSLIEKIDQALAAKSDLRSRCRKCGKTLPVIHAYSVCEDCFRHGRRSYFSRPKHGKFRFR